MQTGLQYGREWGGGGGGARGITHTVHLLTYPSANVVDLVVTEREINTLWLKLSPRDRTVHNANKGHSIVLVVHNKCIQKLKLYQLFHGS